MERYIQGKSISRHTKRLLLQNKISDNPSEPQASVSALMVKLGVPLEEWNRYRDERLSLADQISYDRTLEVTVRQLSAHFRLVINTNNTRHITNRILVKLGLSKCNFSLIVTSDSEMPVKPRSASFLYVADQLRTNPKEMLSVGDRYEVDIEPLLALGGSGVVVTGPEEIPCIAKELLPQNVP
jgi:HAD superfamily hydrolase (TIGR01549 family)